MAPTPASHTTPFVDGMPALELERDAKRAPDRLERRLGDVVRRHAGRLHVQAEAARLRKARST